MKTQGKPDAGNPHVRFDEEEQGNLLLTLLVKEFPAFYYSFSGEWH